MKNIKSYNQFDKVNEELFIPGAGIILVLLFASIQTKMPYLDDNIFKNFHKWFKVSRVIKKYDKLIRELDSKFKDDPEIKSFYRQIKKIGHNTIGYGDASSPLLFFNNLKRYILRRTDNPSEFEDLCTQMEDEIRKAISPSMWDQK